MWLVFLKLGSFQLNSEVKKKQATNYSLNADFANSWLPTPFYCPLTVISLRLQPFQLNMRSLPLDIRSRCYQHPHKRQADFVLQPPMPFKHPHIKHKPQDTKEYRQEALKATLFQCPLFPSVLYFVNIKGCPTAYRNAPNTIFYCIINIIYLILNSYY